MNRILVAYGLQQLNDSPCVGMAALMKVVRVRGKVTAETIAFYIAPRINAAGRMQHGDIAMRLLLSTDREEANVLANELDETNKHRRKIEMQVFKQATEMLGEVSERTVLAVHHEDWHAGVMRLTLSDGQYYLPSIVFGGSVLSASLQVGSIVSLVGQLKADDWKGDDAIQFEVDDVWVNEVVLTV